MTANPSISLKLGAIAFAVLWTLWMLSWSGSFDRINAITRSVCGAAVGYAWYRAMRRQFRRSSRWPQAQDSTN